MKRGALFFIFIILGLSLCATPYSFPLSVVIIDPGHGGVDPGAIGYDGSYEKDVTLAISLRLAQIIEKESDLLVILTRTDDNYLTLEERVKISNTTFPGWDKSAIFISIHVNGSTESMAKGYEFIVRESHKSPPFFTKESANWFLSYTSNFSTSHLRRELNQKSYTLAHYISKAFKQGFKDAKYRGIKELDLYVTNNNVWPSVLVEAGFITNKEEGLLMKDTSWIDEVAQYIYRGIEYYML